MFGVSERWPESESPQYDCPRLSSKLRPNPRAGAKPRLCQSAAVSGHKTFTAGTCRSSDLAFIGRFFFNRENQRKVNVHVKAQFYDDCWDCVLVKNK